MAASTSSVVDSSNCFDVFINHRGPDVKKTFASHLYRRLISYGLRVFLDYQEMQEGEDLNRQIQGAIKTASVHVAIFTPKYAASNWCLDELVLMLESEAPIIPVFHNVKPTDLRRTQGGEGVYARSLLNLEKKRTHESQPRYTSDTIEKWRNALSRVADISGLELEKFDGDEGELVDKVVEVVLKKCKKTQLNVARHPTGLNEMVEDFETKVSFHQHSGTVQIVGITGLGGAGKTTLAKELFNRNSRNDRKSCFLFDVRENAKISLPSLQTRLLKGLSGSEQAIDNKDEGTEILKKLFRTLSSPVLLVLDDVDHEDQVYALLPITDKPLPPNSLILITSRDKDVLARSGVQKPSIYQLNGLNTELSRELFCSHAFCQPHPLSGFEHLVSRFLTACDGLPLSLKVFGGLLYGNIDKSSWEDELEKLQRILPQEIQKRLQISFDALPKDEQQIFLDIACFFIGENRDTAIRVWDGSGWKGLRGFQSLQNKCLVEVEVVEVVVDDPCVKAGTFIRMHDHLRDMGRELAKHPGWPLRLWDGTKNIDDLSQQSSETVRGIRMLRPKYHAGYASSDDDDFSDYKMKNLDDDDFSDYKMKNLRLLDIEIKEDLLKCLLEGVGSRSLFWFRWRNCPCSSLPPILMKKLGALRVLEVNGDKLETLWPEELPAPLQLRELRIYGFFSEIPKSIEQLKYLEHIDLSVCQSLQRLPDSFGNLIQLKYLELRCCICLSSLPDSFGNLSTLEHIDLSNCDSLSSLPDSFGNLNQLKYLDLRSCISLSSLPDSFGNLSTLEHIDLYDCRGLERLPACFENLIQLKYLDLSDCDNLTAFTGTFGRMSMLEYILLPNCHFGVFSSQIARLCPQEKLHLWLVNLKEWPSASGLEELELNMPLFLETLPASLGRDLRNLKYLELRNGQSLKRLPDSFLQLNQLINLIVEDCSLRELHFKAIEGDSETLTDTEVQRTSSNLEGCLLRLQYLVLYNIQISEVSFPTGVCPNLQHLHIMECKDLVEVGALPNALVELQLAGCSKLRKIDASFPKGVYPKLQHLDIRDCQDLVEVGTFSTALVKLQMIGCPKLRQRTRSNLDSSFHECLFTLHNTQISKVSFPTGVCPNLQHLDIRECKDLVEVGALPNALVKLQLYGCSKLRKIDASFPKGVYPNLQHLDIGDCQDLVEVGTFSTALVKLQMIGCPKLRKIAEQICGFAKLQTPDVSRSKEVEELPSIEGKNETVAESRGQRTRSNLDTSFDKCLLSLQHLEPYNTEISEVSFPTGVCPNLEYLIINNGNSLVEFENFPTGGFRKLELSNCSKLRKIEELCGLGNLQILNINWCKGLEELSIMETLVSLEELRVRQCWKLKSIRGLAHLKKLRELDVSGCSELEDLPGVEHLWSLEKLWACCCKKLKSIRVSAQLTQLRELDVSECSELEELPGVEHLRSLEKMQAHSCVKLKGILGLPQLRQLRELHVSFCHGLEELLGVGHLKSLEVLQACGCVKLKSIQGLEQLTQLRELDVSYCYELEELPGVEHLRSLDRLQACNCVKLKSIGWSAQLTQLLELDVSDCFELEELPGLEHLRSLKVLKTCKCVKMKSIQGLAKLIQLRKLDVSGCCVLEDMRDVGYLQSLVVLRASECVKLKSIQGLEQMTQLQKLDVSYCFELEELPGIERLRSLINLQARSCKKLKSIQVSAQLTQLRELDVSFCSELEEMPGVGYLESLVVLRASECVKLTSLWALAQLTQLQELDVSGCSELEEMPDVGYLQSLLVLRASDCVKLKSIHGSAQLTQLLKLDVSRCRGLEELGGVGHLKSLKMLRASGCVKLKSIQVLEQLTQLLELDVCNCFELEELLGVEHLKSLKELLASGCKKLKSIQGLAQLTQLQYLDVSGCYELEVMPGVGHLQSLVMLRASECMRLKRIQGLEQMTQLRELDVSFCFELEELPNVGYLHSLEVLKASACVKLKNIQGLAQLTQLRELDVSFCSELEEMPGVGYLQSLVVLKTCACVKLKSIQGLAQLTQLRELDVSFCSEL